MSPHLTTPLARVAAARLPVFLATLAAVCSPTSSANAASKVAASFSSPQAEIVRVKVTVARQVSLATVRGSTVELERLVMSKRRGKTVKSWETGGLATQLSKRRFAWTTNLPAGRHRVRVVMTDRNNRVLGRSKLRTIEVKKQRPAAALPIPSLPPYSTANPAAPTTTPTPTSPAPDVDAWVPPNGGEVRDGVYALSVPAGTVAAPAAVRINPTSAYAELDGIAADFHIDAAWADGTRRVKVTLPLVDDPTVPDTVPAVAHFRSDGSSELIVEPELEVNRAAGTVSAWTTELSPFVSFSVPFTIANRSGPSKTVQFGGEFLGIRASAPSCSSSFPAGASPTVSGTVLTPVPILNNQPPIRSCADYQAPVVPLRSKARWKLVNNTAAVLGVYITDGAGYVSGHHTDTDVLNTVAFEAANKALDVAGPYAGTDYLLPPGSEVWITAPADSNTDVRFVPNPQATANAFALRQVGALLESKADAIGLYDVLNDCGWALQRSGFRDLPGALKCALTQAQEIAELRKLVKPETLKKLARSLFWIDAGWTVVDTAALTGLTLADARLAYAESEDADEDVAPTGVMTTWEASWTQGVVDTDTHPGGRILVQDDCAYEILRGTGVVGRISWDDCSGEPDAPRPAAAGFAADGSLLVVYGNSGAFYVVKYADSGGELLRSEALPSGPYSRAKVMHGAAFVSGPAVQGSPTRLFRFAPDSLLPTQASQPIPSRVDAGYPYVLAGIGSGFLMIDSGMIHRFNESMTYLGGYRQPQRGEQVSDYRVTSDGSVYSAIGPGSCASQLQLQRADEADAAWTISVPRLVPFCSLAAWDASAAGGVVFASWDAGGYAAVTFVDGDGESQRAVRIPGQLGQPANVLGLTTTTTGEVVVVSQIGSPSRDACFTQQVTTFDSDGTVVDDRKPFGEQCGVANGGRGYALSAPAGFGAGRAFTIIEGQLVAVVDALGPAPVTRSIQAFDTGAQGSTDALWVPTY